MSREPEPIGYDDFGYPIFPPGQEPQFRFPRSIPANSGGLLTGNVGRSIDVASGAQDTILNLNTADTESDTYTITLGIVNRGVQNGAAGWTRPQALIEWGSGGVNHSALVDYISGTRLTVCGSFIRVTGINNPVPGAPAVTMTLAASVGKASGLVGNGLQTGNAQLTFYDVTQSSVLPVPNFARSVLARVPGGSNTPDAVRVSFFEPSGSTFIDYDFGGGAGNNPYLEPQPIPNDADTWGVFAAGAVPYSAVNRIIFGLDL